MTLATRHDARIGLFVVALVCIYYVVIAPFFLGHYDLGWHIAAGDLIRRDAYIPLQDPWSFTAGANQWFNLSWLWDVLQSALLQAGGFTAIILETLLLGALVAAGLFLLCVRNNAAPVPAGIAVFLSCMLYPAFAAPDLFLAATPGVATILGCVIFYDCCLRPEASWGRAPVAMLIWVNMHGGFIIGPCMIAVFLSLALLRREWHRCREYLALLSLTLAATLINPLGISVYQGLLGTLGHFALQYITEWRPYFEVVSIQTATPFCVFLLLFIMLEIADRKGGPVEARLLSWCFLLAGLWKLRYLSIFLLFATLPVALHLGRLLPRLLGQPVNDRLIGVSGLIIFCSLPLLYWWSAPANVGFLPLTFPGQEIDYLTTHRDRPRLLNHWNYGGFIIFKTRGAIPVFVDGRSATAYPDAVLRDFFPLTDWNIDAANWEHVLCKYDIDTIMWPNAHMPLQQLLTGRLGWTLAYSGPIANIYVRPPAQQPCSVQ